LSGNQGIERKRAVKDESWTTKRVLIFLPGNANVYSIKEGDLEEVEEGLKVEDQLD